MKKIISILFLFLLTAFVVKKETPQRQIENLLKKMTLQQKIGQMTQICFSTITLDGTKTLDVSPDKFREAIVKYGVGSFLSGTGQAEKWVDFTHEVQRIAMEETTIKIPLILGIDHVHGANYVDEGTIFPHNLTLSCSFDTSLAHLAAKVTAIETADLGLQWNFAPVLDIGRNPYWPRLYETFGEDPFVCGQMGAAYTRGYQHCPETAPYKSAACAKHFIGYSDPKSGYDRTTSEIPDQVLHELFVPPFKAAFDAGMLTVMVNSGDLNGEPVHGSKKILTGLLRQKMGFDGVILTDIKDIEKIVEMHAGATNFKEAVLLSINAGVDMYMACNSYQFFDVMHELVKEGKISEKRIDESVRRILKLKIDVGLFENPYPRKDRLDRIGAAAHKEAAVNAAKESIVLIKNDKLLPLTDNHRVKNILVAGLAANSKHQLAGAWTYEWLGQPNENFHPKDMQTIFTALQTEFPESKVEYVPEAETKGLDDFKRKSKEADVIVITIGEQPYSEFKGNTNTLALDDKQKELVKAGVMSGKSVILVIVSGRPRIISDISAGVKAILFAGHPGFGGGTAIAQIISGKTNPSGKLSFSYPCEVNSYEPYYRKFSSEYWRKYTKFCYDEFPFGHGLSYTDFQYELLQLSDTVITKGKSITATVKVTNIGKTDGKEAVLWFITDEIGTITRPTKMLKSFEKQLIRAGESKVFSFVIQPEIHLFYPDEKGQKVIENGYFTISVGNQKARFLLK
jgi:beta-glucosidase